MSNLILPLVEVFLGSIVISCASQAVLLVWFQGSIFSGWRGWLEGRSDRHWWCKMLTCSLCLTVHLTFWMIIVFVLPWFLMNADYWQLSCLPLWWLCSISQLRYLNDGGWIVNPAEE